MRRGLDWCKSWPIKQQLVVFNLLALGVVLILLFGMMVFNLLYLQSRTVDQIGQALDSQANDNMRALIKEAGGAGREILYDMEETLEVLSSMLQAMSDENSFSLETLPDRSYDELPQNCLQILPDTYGNDPVCLQYSSSFSLGSASTPLQRSTTRFDTVLPILGSLLGELFIRIMMYFDNAQFIRVFPGSHLPLDYTPAGQQWWNDFVSARRNNTASQLYWDSIGLHQQLLSLMVPMIYGNQSVGVAVAEAPVETINTKLCNLTYLNTGKSVLMAKNGTFFQAGFMGWKDALNMTSVSPETLKSIQEWPLDPLSGVIGPMTFSYSGVEYRCVATTLSGHDANSIWFYIVLIVPESEIMKTRDKASDTISSAGYMCIVSTALVAPVVCFSLFLCVSMFTNRVVKPLHGIVKMSEALSKAESESMVLLQQELQDMDEGNFQVQNLVRAFKDLAMKLIDQHGPSFHEEVSSLSTEDFPYNDLKDSEVPWLEELKLLRNRT
jgi:hypothetical protein